MWFVVPYLDVMAINVVEAKTEELLFYFRKISDVCRAFYLPYNYHLQCSFVDGVNLGKDMGRKCDISVFTEVVLWKMLLLFFWFHCC